MKTFLLTGLLFLLGPADLAGECRTALEPLLLSETPEAKLALFRTCQAEADTGDAEALYWVSFFYFGLLKSTLDEQRGVRSVTASAEKGYAQAQYWMGWQSEMGEF